MKTYLFTLLTVLCLAVSTVASETPPSYPVFRTGDFFSDRFDKTNKMNESVKKTIKERVTVIRRLANEIIKTSSSYENRAGYKALKGLALMQALPYFTENVDRKLSENPAFDANNFNAIKNAIPSGEIIKLVDDHFATNITLAYNTFTVYDACMALMFLEYYYSGGSQIEYKGTPDMDRSFSVNFIPAGKEDQQRIVKLTTALMGTGISKGFETMNVGSLWHYTSFGASGEANTCAHKSSFGMMGLRAAINMGILDFDDTAFEFPLKKDAPNIGKQAFLDRLSDVMIHSVFATWVVPAAKDPATGKFAPKMAMSGWDNFKDYQKTNYTNYLKDKKEATGKDVDKDKYIEFVTKTDKTFSMDDFYERYVLGYGGEKVIFEKQPDSPAKTTPSDSEVTYYTYTPSSSYGYGTYQTACGAYVLATAANAVPLLVGAKDRYKEQAKKNPPSSSPAPSTPTLSYSCQYGDDLTKLKYGDKEYCISFDPSLPYTPMKIGAEPVYKRIDESINFIVCMTTTPDGDAPRRSHNKPIETSFLCWSQSISFLDNRYLSLWFYSYLKLGMSIGEPDYFGPWPYYEEISQFLCDAVNNTKVNDKDTNHPANPIVNDNVFREFTILVLTGAFRPLYGQTNSP